MNRLMFVTILMATFVSSIFVASANENSCTGDAVRSTPPIPNYPTHIRNVVWRNTRALCLAQLAQKESIKPASQIPLR